MLRLEVKAGLAVTEEGAIEGLASVFGTADRGGDVVHRGAFAGAKFPIPMLASHDPADVVGVWTEGAETAEGLRVKGRLTMTVRRAQEVRDLIMSEALGGLSIGYVATKKAARAKGGRDLFAVDLVEISVVAVPMHPGARITSAKAADTKGGVMDPDELEAKLQEYETKAAGAVASAVADALKQITERLDKIEVKAGRLPAPSINRGGGDDLSVERKAFHAYLQRGNLIPEAEAKALTVSSDPNGGYLAPAEVSSEIIKDIVSMSPMRSVSSVRSISTDSVIYPKRNPMGNATWDTMDTSATPETTSTAMFGQLEVVTKGCSTFVDIPNSLLADAPAVEAEVRAAIAEDFAKKESTAFVLGAGLNDPEGVMTNADISFWSAGAATLTSPDPLIKLLYSFQPEYRNTGMWAMNGTTLGVLRTLADTTGQKFWQPSLQAGQPEMILGRPVLEVVDMPDIAANAFPILYGDFSGYRIVDRAAVSVLVDPYSQAINKKTRYHFWRRVGGRVLQPIKFKKLKMA